MVGGIPGLDGPDMWSNVNVHSVDNVARDLEGANRNIRWGKTHEVEENDN